MSAWQLVVENTTRSTTACLILRRGWGSSLRTIGEELLKRGIPFHTYIPRPTELIYNDAHHHTNLSWRSVSLGYHYGSTGLAADYCSYVNIRNKFLQIHSGRAALLRGGIIWRLAMDALGYESALEQVLAGPSADCVDFGGMPQYLADGSELWDDVLSDEEVDLICGVYKASTGEFLSLRVPLYSLVTMLAVNANQTQDLSWWPKFTCWKGCGLDVGYWSIDCETWYVARREAILKNDTRIGKLRNATQWRNALKFARKPCQTVVTETNLFHERLLAA